MDDANIAKVPIGYNAGAFRPSWHPEDGPGTTWSREHLLFAPTGRHQRQNLVSPVGFQRHSPRVHPVRITDHPGILQKTCIFFGLLDYFRHLRGVPGILPVGCRIIDKSCLVIQAHGEQKHSAGKEHFEAGFLRLRGCPKSAAPTALNPTAARTMIGISAPSARLSEGFSSGKASDIALGKSNSG